MNRDASTRAALSPSERLQQEPYAFDFHQAVRLLALAAWHDMSGRAARRDVGHDFPPDEETVRFRALISHAFPPATIARFQVPAPFEGGEKTRPPEMTVAFIGMVGPLGVLPHHYTQMVIDRVRARDYALRDFLDLFHHRIVSFFHRAWVKYHIPALYETAKRSAPPDHSDLFTRSLLSLVGLGTSGLRDRLRVPDESLLYYSGNFAHFPRDATSLERMIEEQFGVPARLLQFLGQWLQLEEPEQTRLMTPRLGHGWNNRLGVTTVAGRRVWGVESKFRIRLGPLTFSQFIEFSPLGRRLLQLLHFVRAYVGPDLDCDIQPVLRRSDVPGCRLGDAQVSRLGWTTWTLSRPAREDADDAVFDLEADRVR